MKCDMNIETLLAYLDGELSALERGRVAEHIVACEPCRTTVNELREVSEVLSRWEAPEPVGLPPASALLERAGVEAPVEPAPAAPAWPRRWWAAAAALLVVAGIVGLLTVPMMLGPDEALVAQAPAETGVAPAPESAGTAAGAGAPATETPEGGEAPPSSPVQPQITAPQPAARPQPPAAPAEAAGGAAPADGPEQKAADENVAVTATEPAAPPAAAPQQTPQPLAAAPAPAAEAEKEDARAEAPPPAKPSTAGRAARAKRRDAASATYIRSARLRLGASDRNAAADRVAAAAESVGGRVVGRSSARGGVRIVVEVPADRFDEAYSRIKEIGSVRGETRSNRDISARLDEIDDAIGSRGFADSANEARSEAELQRERVELLERARHATIDVTVGEP